ncbi:hypothetical protein FZEAL_3069 [Fusarium zealandicum]|uniref:Amine oxidase n=1 Tax=Fusarium zealandicum TaxID=1053134 RepID=A0A8H4UQ92_9HYPO|nr:hypothetical protein FZEAL_3069 [Fusarium zealandicum]
MTDQQDRLYDCIVVSAGYSGLAAAKALHEHASRPRFLVLEARDRVGGRARTIHLGDGKYWDVGGSFLGLKQDAMYSLAREYGVEVFPIPQKGKIIFRYRGQAKGYSGLIPPLKPWEVIDAGLVLQQLERLVRSIDVEAPWAHPKAKAWDKITLEEWIRRHTFTKAGRAMMEMAIPAIFGRSSCDISLLYAVYVLKTLGSATAAFSSDGGLQQDMTKGGGTAIAERIREGIGGDQTVRLSEPVQRVKYTDGDTNCTITTTKGEYRTKRVIFAVPPQFAAKVNFDPCLPGQKKALLESMELGAYTKVFATYKTPFWRDDGLRGEATSLEGYISVSYDATSPEAGAEGKLMGFATGSKAREFATLSKDEQRRIALEEFAGMFGRQALEPIEFFYHSMLHEEWAGGCPLASPPPGIMTTHFEWIRRPVGPIHWAGTETSTRFYGYMEGAVSAGRRAAQEVVEALGLKG